MIPYQDIRDSEDRSWSLTLIDEIRCGHLQDLQEIVRTLGALDDPRVPPPLIDLLGNTELPEAIRQAASDALAQCSSTESSTQRSEWWGSGDSVLMRHAVRSACRSESAVIEAVAGDPKHPFHIDAINTLGQAGIGWEEPKFQELKIRALSHPDAEVREAAAATLLWDEPIAAEDALLKAAVDPVDAVAEEALDTLAYYANRRLLRSLDDLRREGRPSLRDAYDSTFYWVQSEFIGYLEGYRWQNRSFKDRFEAWLEPVRDLLPSTPEGSNNSTSSCSAEPERQRPAAQSIIDSLSEADGQWLEKRQRYTGMRWQDFDASERLTLADYLGRHSDPAVREIACWACADWEQTERLLEFLNDLAIGVRKSAAYCLRRVPRNTNVAGRLWTLLLDDSTQGCHASETLESYIVHADNDGLEDKLVQLARHDARESVRYKAIWSLNERAARDSLITLSPILLEAPIVTWGPHIALLSACTKHNIQMPGLNDLALVDNLHLQVAVCEAAAQWCL